MHLLWSSLSFSSCMAWNPEELLSSVKPDILTDLHSHKFDIQICSSQGREGNHQHWHSLVGDINLEKKETRLLSDRYSLLSAALAARKERTSASVRLTVRVNGLIKKPYILSHFSSVSSFTLLRGLMVSLKNLIS